MPRSNAIKSIENLPDKLIAQLVKQLGLESISSRSFDKVRQLLRDYTQLSCPRPNCRKNLVPYNQNENSIDIIRPACLFCEIIYDDSETMNFFSRIPESRIPKDLLRHII